MRKRQCVRAVGENGRELMKKNSFKAASVCFIRKGKLLRENDPIPP